MKIGVFVCAAAACAIWFLVATRTGNESGNGEHLLFLGGLFTLVLGWATGAGFAAVSDLSRAKAQAEEARDRARHAEAILRRNLDEMQLLLQRQRELQSAERTELEDATRREVAEYREQRDAIERDYQRRIITLELQRTAEKREMDREFQSAERNLDNRRAALDSRERLISAREAEYAKIEPQIADFQFWQRIPGERRKIAEAKRAATDELEEARRKHRAMEEATIAARRAVTSALELHSQCERIHAKLASNALPKMESIRAARSLAEELRALHGESHGRRD